MSKGNKDISKDKERQQKTSKQYTPSDLHGVLSPKGKSAEVIKIMKTMNFIASIIASVMVTVSANAESLNKTKTSNAMPKTVEVAQTNIRTMIQTTDNGFTYKYDFILDTEGRVINRVTSTWNDKNHSWSPLAAYSIAYTNDETVLTYAKYNKHSKTYSKDVQQKRYNASEYPILFNIPECCK